MALKTSLWSNIRRQRSLLYNEHVILGVHTHSGIIMNWPVGWQQPCHACHSLAIPHTWQTQTGAPWFTAIEDTSSKLQARNQKFKCPKHILTWGCVNLAQQSSHLENASESTVLKLMIEGSSLIGSSWNAVFYGRIELERNTQPWHWLRNRSDIGK